jgi:hypothetical protein
MKSKFYENASQVMQIVPRKEQSQQIPERFQLSLAQLVYEVDLKIS